MIEYHYELDFVIANTGEYSDWIRRVVASEGYTIDHLNYVFCEDEYLLELNIKHLKHNTLTDILTFDYSVGDELLADIFISIERVKENASDLKTEFDIELLRVMSHGVLHLIGYNDKSDDEAVEMRLKEEEKIKMFHVEQ